MNVRAKMATARPSSPQARAFDRGFHGLLPLPLARLYARAHHAKVERERHDHAFHLLEASLKLAASALVSRYRRCGNRSEKVDETLRFLARPSLGQWWRIFREAIGFLEGPTVADPWARRISERLGKGRDESTLPDVLAAMAGAAALAGQRSARPSALEVLDLLPAYRNAMSDAHGSIKANPEVYRDATPALLALVRILLEDGALLGSGRLVYAEDVRVSPDGQHRVVWMDLTGPTAMRRQALGGEPEAGNVLPERLYLEIGPQEPLPLHPLLYYQPGEMLDQVFYLNRARAGRSGVQFLSYETGEFYLPGRDPEGDSLVRELEVLLSWATSRQVGSGEREALAAESHAACRAQGEKLEEEKESRPVGKVFGDFEILGELGRGGMAVVYLAKQRSLDRTVALKVLPPVLKEHPVAPARFRQEVRALSRCDHPNVVKILSSGQTEGTYFYAMEFIDGADLAAIGETLKRYRSSGLEDLREGHFDRAASTASGGSRKDLTAGLPEVARIEKETLEGYAAGPDIAFRLAAVMRDAARGVQHVHEHGIIHRDLKPQNIMVTRDEHRPVVMDLGLAKMTGVSQSLTVDKGGVIGTLRYMPPEQLQRNLLEVDSRADVYALGAVLYELACFRPMLDGDSEERLTAQILFEQPPHPQKANLRLPSDLATIIVKATHKDPRDRYASAAELVEDLDRFVHGEAISARPPTLGYLLRLYVRRNRTRVVAALTTVLLFAALLVGWLVSTRAAWVREKDAREVAQAALQKERAAKRALEGAQRETQNALGETRENLAQLFLEMAGRSLAECTYQRAAVYAAASLRQMDTALARGRLYSARVGADRKPIWSTTSGVTPTGLAFSPDGSLLASGSLDHAVRLWDVVSGQEAAVLEGHAAAIHCVAFDSKGARLASGAADATARLWAVATGEELALLGGHVGGVMAVAFSPDGGRLATASADGAVQFWDAATGAGESRLAAHDGMVWSVAFSPDGRRLATGSADHQVALWDVADGTAKEIARLSGHTDEVWSVAFSPDGRRLASGSFDRTIRLWELEPPREVGRLEGHAEHVHPVAFSPDGAFLASASDDATVRLWDLASSREWKVFQGHTGWVHGLALSPDGKRIASSSADDTLRLWEVGTGREIARVEAQAGGVEAVAFSANGTRVASGSRGGVIQVREASSGNRLGQFQAHPRGVEAVVFTRDGSRLWSASRDHTVRLWNLETGTEVARGERHREAIVSLALSPDEKLLASAGHDGIWLWDGESGKEVAQLDSRPAWAAAFRSDGTRLASSGPEGSVRLWDVTKRQEVDRMDGHRAGVGALAFSPRGDYLASASDDNTVWLWDAASGKGLVRLEGHTHYVTCTVFAPDGRWLATGSVDGTVRLWDVPSGRKLARLEGDPWEVRSLAVSPEGTWLVSGGPAAIHLWDVASWRRVKPLEGHAGRVAQVAISPDDRLLASGSFDGTVRLWDLETHAEVAQLEASSPGEEIESVAFNSGGTLLASGSGRGAIQLWDVATGKRRSRLEGHERRVESLVFGPRDAFLASGSRDRRILIWDPVTGAERKRLEGHEDGILSVASSPDGARLASVGGVTLWLWDIGTGEGKLLARMEGHAVRLWAVAFGPDGARLATGSADGSVRLWDVKTGKQLLRLEGHAVGVGTVAFSPSGSHLASGADDKTVRLWEVSSGREVARLEGHLVYVSSVAFSPNGRWLASGSNDSTVRLWDLDLLAESPEGILSRMERETGLVLQGTEARLPRRATTGQFTLLVEGASRGE